MVVTLDWDVFMRARGLYWQQMLKRNNPDVELKTGVPLATDFIIHAQGPDNWFAVFEDERDTGYLYLYDVQSRRIEQHVHVYDRSEKLKVAPEDVRVVWSADGTKCGVIVWRQMRAIIDRTKDRAGRVWLESRNTPGIADQEWLSGFEANLR